jgi:nucleoside-diphosphate-sugar epimerase
MKTALVCGAGGFIGGHLVKKLKREGYWVRGVDVKEHEFAETQADEFLLLDLREPHNCWEALTLGPGRPGRHSELVEESRRDPAVRSGGPSAGSGGPSTGSGQAFDDASSKTTFDDASSNRTTFDDASSNKTTFDEVYQLAADMGGMGFIHSAECEIMRNSALINIHMIDAATRIGVGRYFFSSSACVYPDMAPGDPAMTEDEVVPANPDNEYGWEKYYAERMARAYARHYPIEVRVARFQNCYGPEGTWRGGREKAPAAICRKVAMAPEGGTIPVWGDGTAVRGFTYVDDLVDGIYLLTQSDLREAANIGTEEYVTVNELVETVIEVSGKEIGVEHVEGPVGVQARNFSHARMHELGWEAETSLREGIERTYAWIKEQVDTFERLNV